MVNYQDGKIYALYEGDKLLYIGSTTQSLPARFSRHKKDCNYKQMQIYNYINSRDDKWSCIYIELIEDCPCDNKAQLERREGELIRERKPEFNTRIAVGLTKQEVRRKYREKNKEKIAEYKKQYRQENKEQIAEYKRQYRKNKKDNISL